MGCLTLLSCNMVRQRQRSIPRCFQPLSTKLTRIGQNARVQATGVSGFSIHVVAH